jgi:hypothetical protein
MATMMTALSSGASLTHDIVSGLFILSFFPVRRHAGLRFVTWVGFSPSDSRKRHHREKETDRQKPHCLLQVLFY